MGRWSVEGGDGGEISRRLGGDRGEMGGDGEIGAGRGNMGWREEGGGVRGVWGHS